MAPECPQASVLPVHFRDHVYLPKEAAFRKIFGPIPEDDLASRGEAGPL